VTKQAILLVEDNDDDAELTFKAFQQARIANPIVRVRDGVEALEYLLGSSKEPAKKAHEIPAVILLDLNLPRLDGIEVLRRVRGDVRVKHVPVVILTSSNEDRDRLAAYDEHANSYVRKPVDYDRFVAASKDLGLYWLVLNEPPPAREE
jgi:two-component system, response regulator